MGKTDLCECADKNKGLHQQDYAVGRFTDVCKVTVLCI